MQNSNHEWMKRCFNCMEPVDAPDAKCTKCGWDNHNRENGNGALEQTVLKDQYVVGKNLGCDGFGINYVGFDLTSERRIVIKEFFPIADAYRHEDAVTVCASTGAEENFERGLKWALGISRTAATLGQIPNVLQVYDVFLENGTVYMIIEYLECTSLREEVKQNNRLNWRKALHLMYPIMSALEKIHEKGFIHCSISLRNIILRKETGDPVLLECDYAQQPKKDLLITWTRGYSPPEQHMRDCELDGRVDEYALCAVLYYLMTGITPVSAVTRLYDENEQKRPRKYAADIPSKVEKVLLKGMELDRDDRYSLIQELHKAFLTAEKESTWNANKIAGILMASAVAVACLIGFLGFRNTGRDKDTDKGTAVSSEAESVVDKEEKAEAEEDEATIPEPTNTPTPEPTNTPAAEPTKSIVISTGYSAGYVDIEGEIVPNGGSVSLLLTPGTRYQLTAYGAGTDNYNPKQGDVRYLPRGWAQGDGSIQSIWEFFSSRGISSEKEIPIRVYYLKQTWNEATGKWKPASGTVSDDTVRSSGYYTTHFIKTIPYDPSTGTPTVSVRH